MQGYVVELKCEIPKTFRTTKAANSVCLNTDEKSVHRVEIAGRVPDEFAVGLIVGGSGSGKTTLAKEIFGSLSEHKLNEDVPVIEQLPKEWAYDKCVSALTGVGLTSIPCWVRPLKTLSTGQRYRAEVVIRLGNAKPGETIVIDEWTSTVDRTIARIMSHNVAKYVRAQKGRVVFVTCHYDVEPWLSPDWVIDVNQCEFREPKKKEKNSSLSFLQAIESRGVFFHSIII